ncbi:MAG: PKD domain-containing protein, partial [Planctomycetes bacterium]|nr:PKD domain-containing protein [Planctomycetota bacterium]
MRKYDANGNELWTRQFGSSAHDFAHDISVDSFGVYVVGSAGGALPGQTSYGAEDAFVRRCDFDGNELWTRQFGTLSGDAALAVSVDSTGVYVAGQTYGALPGQTRSGWSDAFVRKYDLNGSELWTRQFGGTFSVKGAALSIDSTGVYVAGIATGTLPGQTSLGSVDAFVRKYDLNGSELWTRQFGSSAHDLASDVFVDPSGVLVAGATYGTLPGETNSGFGDAFVQKFDTNGYVLWTSQVGSSGFDAAYAVSADSAGVYVAGVTGGTLTGQTNSGGNDAYVLKLTEFSMLPPPGGNQPPVANAGGPSYAGTEGSPITLDAAASFDPDGDPLFYRWDLDENGDYDTSWSPLPSIQTTFPDNYLGTVRVQVSDRYLLSEATAPIEIFNVRPQVDLSFDPANPVVGDPVTFTAVITDPGSDTHTLVWDFRDGAILAGPPTVQHLFVAGGHYPVNVTVTDDDGDDRKATVPVSVAPAALTVDASGAGDFTSVQPALDAAQPYDRIFVRNGTYIENIVISKPVSLVGEGAGATILDGGGITHVIRVMADAVEIKGFTLRNSGSCAIYAGSIGSTGPSVSLSEITGNSGGICLENGSGTAQIKDNWIHDNTLAGIHLFNWLVPPGAAIIQANRIENNGAVAIRIQSSGPNVQVTNNINSGVNPVSNTPNGIYGHETAVLIEQSDQITIEYNTL